MDSSTYVMQIPGARVCGFRVLSCTYPLSWRKKMSIAYWYVRGAGRKAKPLAEAKGQAVSGGL